MEFGLKVIRRGTTSQVSVQGGVDGDAHVSQYLPSGAVITALGKGFQAMATTGVAALLVRPTTTAMATLWNGDTSKSYVIKRAFVQAMLSYTTNTKYSLWLCVHPSGMAAPSNDITIRNNTGGNSTATTSAYFDNGATVEENGWFPYAVGETKDGGAGSVAIAEINGDIVLPPSAGLSLQVVAMVALHTFCGGFHWLEVDKVY